MILDISVVVALVADEPACTWIRQTLDEHPREQLRMSWANIAEVGVVLERAAGGASAQLEAALAALGVEPLDADVLATDLPVVLHPKRRAPRVAPSKRPSR